MNELRIRDGSHLTNDELVAALATVGPGAVKGRWRTPPPVRFLPMPSDRQWAGSRSRTCCVATGRDMFLTADHDGRLVADLVAEWASIHGEPFELLLEGPAGGTFSQGDGGQRVEIDAIDFVRTLCGRLPGTGVLGHRLPL